MECKYESIFKELKNFYNISAVSPETDISSGEAQNNQIFFNNLAEVENIAKIKWYGNKEIIFQVSSIAKLNLPLAELSEDSEKSQGTENTPGPKKLLVTIILVDNLNWVTLVIKQAGQKYQVYYADFLGSTREDLPEGIKNALQDPQYEVINCTKEIEKRADESESVIIALKDADVIVNILNRNETFESLQDFKLTFGQKSAYPDNDLQSYKKNLDEKLHAKERMESRIKICRKIFDRLNDKPINEFSYENVNAFLFFLEATALENSSELGDQYLDKVKDDIIGRDNSNLIKEIRKLLLHSHHPRVVEQKDLDDTIKELVKEELIASAFFSQLGAYIKQIDENLQNNAIKSSSSITESFELTSLLKLTSEIQKIYEMKEFGTKPDKTEIRKKLSTTTKYFLKEIGEKPDTERGEEIMFNLTVNFMNAFEADHRGQRNDFKSNGLEEMRKFRNMIFHNFHADDEIDLEHSLRRNFTLKEGMRKLLDCYFKYDFCLSVCESFEKSDLDSVPETLTTMQDDWKKNYSAVVSKLFEPTDEENKRDDLEFVHEYLKLIIVIDNEHVKSERESERVAKKNQVMHRKLNSIDRKHIYRKFESNENNEKLAKELKEVHGIWIPKSYLKQMEDSYVNDIVPEILKEIVSNDIRVLLSIRNKYKLSTQNLIDLYDYSIQKKDNSVLLGRSNLLKQKESINVKLNGLASNKIKYIDLKIKNKNGEEIITTINVAEINRNLIEMFDDDILYPSLSMSIDEIFSDWIFLDYLLNENIQINLEFLATVEFTAPYIAKLIMENEEAQKYITTDIFTDTVKNLLAKDRFCVYLKELLEAINGRNFSLQANETGLTLEEIKNKVHNQIKKQIYEDSTQFNILCLFKKPELVEEILSGLDDLKQKRMGVRVLERAAIELCQSGNYGTVSEILKLQKVGDLIDELFENVFNNNIRKRRKARTKNKEKKYHKNCNYCLVLPLEKSKIKSQAHTTFQELTKKKSKPFLEVLGEKNCLMP